MSALVGVMAALEGPALEEARRLWKWFEDQYGCREVYTSWIPHLAFQGGTCDDIAPIARGFDQLASTVIPFDLVTDGIATFEAPVRVIYMRVILTDELRQFHRHINQFLEAHCQKTLDLYQPDRWVPHISLAVEDISEESFKQALQELSGAPPIVPCGAP